MLFKKSLVQELIITAFSAFIILFGIIVAQRSGLLVSVAARGAMPNDAIATMLGLNLVQYLPMILSLTLFLAVLMTLSRWHRDSEMVVWFSSGLSISSWIRPVLSFAVPVIVVIGILSLFVMPWATQKVNTYMAQIESRDELSTINPGVFKESTGADRVYFIESFDELGKVVKNIFVQSTQHQKVGVMVANNGHREVEKNGDSFLVMQKGRRYESLPNSSEITTTEFERYAIRVKTKEVKEKPLNVQGQDTTALFSSHVPAASGEIQRRLSLPIAAFILVLLAIPISFVDPRAGRSLNLVLALLIYFIYNNLLTVMQAWITQGKLSPLIGLWPIHVLFLAFTLYVYYRRLFQLPLLPKLFNRQNKLSQIIKMHDVNSFVTDSSIK